MSETNLPVIDSRMVVSSRIRLARNLKKYPFPSRLSEEAAREMKLELHDLLKEYPHETFDFLDMKNVTSVQAGAMTEEHLISPDFGRNGEKTALLLGREKTLSVMINEEDHLRIQAMGFGSCLEDLYRRINELDDYIDGKVEYAFSDKYGYLTSCPTNLGTGIRASVMLHLPALTRRGLMERVIHSVSQVGITVRGLYGEGTQAGACLYQVSNSYSLGISESETIALLNRIVAQICESEKKARENQFPDLRARDELYRSYGILKECRMLTSAEFRTLYSKVRLAAEEGLLELDIPALDRLFIECQPYNLMLTGDSESENERDQRRATLVRERMRG
ncbi:MAG: protein arginine kinase [Clostridia bacterium]|nr:protein arginine kinase [Clostridia bacterium]